MNGLTKKIVWEYASDHKDLLNVTRTIILFGNNVSTYKFALLATLTKRDSCSEISYTDVKEPFVKELFAHYQHNPVQYTGGPNSLTKAFDQFSLSARTNNDWEKVLNTAESLIYNNVFDAFHNVGSGTIDEKYSLFEHDVKGRRIVLKDNLNALLDNPEFKVLIENENQGRWRVVEEAWRVKLSPNLLEYNDVDGQFYSRRKDERVCLRSAVSILLPYQHGKCFYCYRQINTRAQKDQSDFPDVDHFLPLSFLVNFNIQPVNPNGIWNLVVACKECNRGGFGKFNSFPDSRYFTRLIFRNQLFVEEHKHSLKNSILLSLAVNNSAELTKRMQLLWNKFQYIKGWAPKIIHS